ncbi:hypothetical protein LTR66_002291 [Elasticomyces elasticus]|nr:hypothetical protein LTR66_002291 [Elasticomyces elasticus]
MPYNIERHFNASHRNLAATTFHTPQANNVVPTDLKKAGPLLRRTNGMMQHLECPESLLPLTMTSPEAVGTAFGTGSQRVEQSVVFSESPASAGLSAAVTCQAWGIRKAPKSRGQKSPATVSRVGRLEVSRALHRVFAKSES